MDEWSVSLKHLINGLNIIDLLIIIVKLLDQILVCIVCISVCIEFHRISKLTL